MKYTTLIQRLTLAFLTILLVPALATASGSRDTSSNAMVCGGAYSKSELVHKLQSGDCKHSASELRSVFGPYGIDAQTINSSETVTGSVTKSGKVIVGGKAVATSAQSYGHSFISGSHRVGSLYARPTSVSFLSDSLPAFVIMQNHRFKYAVLMSCGNLVTALPSTAPAHTSAAVQQPVVNVVQIQAQSQTQTQATPTPAPAPTPVAAVQTLPSTGATTNVAGAVTLTLVAAAYYVRGKRKLQQTLRSVVSA